MDSAAWSALGTWVTVLIYVLLLVYAVQEVAEAKKMRTAQTRPFVIVDFEPDFAIYLTVSNIGATMARDVTFAFDPPLVCTLNKPWPVSESPLLNHGASALPPGRRHRILFDVSFQRLANDELPRQHNVVISYRDDFDNKYREEYALDLSLMLHTTPAPKGLSSVVSELENISKIIGSWTDGSNGLLVYALDKKEVMEEHRRWIEELRKDQEPPPDVEEALATQSQPADPRSVVNQEDHRQSADSDS